MDSDLVKMLFRDKISEAESLIQLRKSALETRQLEYNQAKRAMDSQKKSLESAQSELDYLLKHREAALSDDSGK